MSHQTLIKRDAVKESDTWRLEDIFPTDELVNEAMKASYEAISAFSQYEGKLTSSGETLYTALDYLDTFSIEIEKIYVYTHMRLHQDGSNSFYQALSGEAEKLMIDANTAMAFVNPELSTLTSESLDTLIASYEPLSLYKRSIEEILRQKEHILDHHTESLLSQFGEVGNAPRNIFAMFNNADIQFPVIENEEGIAIQLTHGNFITFLQSKDRTVREKAFKAIYETYSNFKNTLGTTFSANIKQAHLFAKIRRFDSVRSQCLSANNIPLEVYDNLVQTVGDNVHLMHDYLAVRKQNLGVDTLHMYDLHLPLVKDFDKKITFDEACAIVLESVKPLGDDYVALIKTAFDNRWIDKYENVGKRSGAYSWGCHGAPHPYVLMNYTDNLNNLFTLAHEMGHAIHSYLSHHTQPYPYASYCIFVAEVASTVNEALLMQYLLKTTTDMQYRKYLLNHFMEQFRNTLYRQTMFAEFEKDVYHFAEQGKTLTTQHLSDSYYALVKKYHGDDMVVDSEIAMEWARIPHFYNSPFYVYQYSTGFSAAIALSNRILEEGKPAVDAYKAFLSGGSSKDPIDLLKDAGVDMSTAQPIEDALEVFKSLIEEFKSL